MPEIADTGATERSAAAAGAGWQTLSRRRVLRGAAGAGVAGVAATALLGTMMPASAAARPAAARRAQGRPDATAAAGGSPEEPIIAHVRDLASGEIDLFRGTTQTRLHDRALAARLARATR